MRDLPGFDAFAADHVRPLARTALALTGEPEAARALVVTALSAVAARWGTARWSFPAQATRKALYAAYLERPRPGATAGRGTHPSHTPGTSPPSLTPGTDAAALAEALTALPPRRRALVVACFHDGHTTWQAAGLCRMDARTANTETVLAVAELRDRLPASFVAGTAPETGVGTASDTTGGTGPDTTASTGPETPAETAPGSAMGTAPEPEPAGPPPGSWTSPSGLTDPAPSSWASPSGPAGPSPSPWASPSGLTDPAPSPWASPSGSAGPAPGSWGSPSEAGRAAGPAAAAPGSFAAPAGGTPPYHAAPFSTSPAIAPVAPAGGTGAGDLGDGPWEAALRRELAALSAGMPALDPAPLAAEAARAGRRHRTRRRAVVTAVSVTLAALVVVPLALGVTSLAGRVERAVGDGTPGASGSPDVSAAIPGTLRAPLPAPVRFAYQGSCTDDDWDAFAEKFANGCDQWRLVTTTGEQWRVPDVALDPGGHWNPSLLAISQDGNHVAYYGQTSPDFMVLDRRRARAERSGMFPLNEDASPQDSHLVISPKGRWMAADFGAGARAPLPRVQSLTGYRVAVLPRRMRILAVGDDGTVTGTATWDTNAIPGRLATTVLLRVRPNGRTLSSAPIDPALFESGVAVSPDGRAVAVAAERAHPGDDDHGQVVTLDSATGRVLTRREAALPPDAHVTVVCGWASDHEVIVEARQPDDEDEEEYSVHAVDVRTGAARPITLDRAGGVPDLWVPGTLR
ncbi:hypothetical protein [Microbispora amethystogenes]|uniref:RNA polymerase sigma factor 70 region 4 type 2 domain-containing protein n=1 Tax=Microbispora amethystogenes TaxID=1427754 RepID=A0ABQ4F782_9ACTN|nr:hypothetical protein [Microbispora amethystogenes]GIH30679.1 hypothetical protein Mam01_08430 [Microbispora amethystogenes]